MRNLPEFLEWEPLATTPLNNEKLAEFLEEETPALSLHHSIMINLPEFPEEELLPVPHLIMRNLPELLEAETLAYATFSTEKLALASSGESSCRYPT